MKTLISAIILVLFTTFITNSIFAQNSKDTTSIEKPKIFLLTKNDGTEILGKIISQDPREILIHTDNIGDVYVPKHEVKSIKEVDPDEYKEFGTEGLFATRYFITTNGLPIKKGENYIQWNIYGPDFQFGVAKNFGVGVMTSWMAIPIIANAKYTIPLGNNTNLALGMLAGTGSWSAPDFGLLLPFAAFTIGDRKNNITFSSGYGTVFYKDSQYDYITNTSTESKVNEGRLLLSIAGMVKISPKLSLVFDSFIVPKGPYQTNTEYVYTDNFDPITGDFIGTTSTSRQVRERGSNLSIIMPGIRWQVDSNKAFQFGFTGVNFDNNFVPVPIPMVQWYRKL